MSSERLSEVIRRARDEKGRGQTIPVRTAEVDSWSARAANLEAEVDRLREEIKELRKPKGATP